MNFTASQWKNTLSESGLSSFDDWWNIQADTIEPENTRKGWSNVIDHYLADGTRVFVKRQENFRPQNWYHRFRNRLTFELEFENHQKLHAAGIRTFELIYSESRTSNGNRQAVFVTKELDGYSPLIELMHYWHEHGWPSHTDRRRVLKPVVTLAQKLHQANILHNAFNGRHIFVNIPIGANGPEIPTNIETALIDLEGVKTLKPKSDLGVLRDLLSLNRRMRYWPNKDRLWFFKQYTGNDKITQAEKILLQKFFARTQELNDRP